MSEPLRFMDFADQTPTKAIMRLYWGGPVCIPAPAAAMQFFLPDDWISPYLQQLHRRPYQLREARIHALWQIGCRKQAQAVYWHGKLKKARR